MDPTDTEQSSNQNCNLDSGDVGRELSHLGDFAVNSNLQNDQLQPFDHQPGSIVVDCNQIQHQSLYSIYGYVHINENICPRNICNEIFTFMREHRLLKPECLCGEEGDETVGMRCVYGKCINRVLNIECHSGCVRCQNKRIYQGVNNILCVRGVGVGEQGLITARKIKKGDPIIEFVGLVEKSTQEGQSSRHTLAIPQTDLLIDAAKYSNHSRFIRIQPNPNSSLQIWIVDGKFRAYFMALRDIEEREEITFSGHLHHRCFMNLIGNFPLVDEIPENTATHHLDADLKYGKIFSALWTAILCFKERTSQLMTDSQRQLHQQKLTKLITLVILSYEIIQDPQTELARDVESSETVLPSVTTIIKMCDQVDETNGQDDDQNVPEKSMLEIESTGQDEYGPWDRDSPPNELSMEENNNNGECEYQLDGDDQFIQLESDREDNNYDYSSDETLFLKISKKKRTVRKKSSKRMETPPQKAEASTSAPIKEKVLPPKRRPSTRSQKAEILLPEQKPRPNTRSKKARGSKTTSNDDSTSLEASYARGELKCHPNYSKWLSDCSKDDLVVRVQNLDKDDIQASTNPHDTSSIQVNETDNTEQSRLLKRSSNSAENQTQSKKQRVKRPRPAKVSKKKDCESEPILESIETPDTEFVTADLMYSAGRDVEIEIASVNEIFEDVTNPDPQDSDPAPNNDDDDEQEDAKIGFSAFTSDESDDGEQDSQEEVNEDADQSNNKCSPHPSQQQASNQRPDSSPGSFQCQHCELKFETLRICDLHQIICPFGPNPMTKIPCRRLGCGGLYKSVKTLKQHEKICTEGELAFSEIKNYCLPLNLRKKRYSESEKRFSCKFGCGRKFTESTQKSTHELHMCRANPDISPFECETCHRWFESSYKLRLHGPCKAGSGRILPPTQERKKKESEEKK